MKRRYTEKTKNGNKETISLRNSLDLAFKKDDKIKVNILKIVDLRDKAVHLLIPELQGIASRIFQSGVFNYASKFEDFCEVPFINTANVGMLSLVGDFKTPPLPMMKSIYGSAATEMLGLATDLTKAIEESNDVAFAIPLNVTLQFATKDDKGTQIILAKAEDGVLGLQKALTIIKSVDAEKTHPYRQNEAIREINLRLIDRYNLNKLKLCLVAQKNNKPTFNTYCFQSSIYKFKWKTVNNKYHHYLSTANTHLYSDAAIEYIIDKITSNNDFLKKSKSDFGQRPKN